MCGRFNVMTSAQGFVDLLQILVRVDSTVGNRPRFNVAPSQGVLAVRRSSPQQQAEMVMLRWGLIPHWAKDRSIGNRMINARSETAAEKPSFRQAYKSSRCLIAADGWYEWRKMSAGKQPYNIRRKDGSPLFFAGLWAGWQGSGPEGENLILETCTILTADADASLRYIHPRMPVVLRPGLYEQWIDGTITRAEKVSGIIRSRAVDAFEAYPVSSYVNIPANDSERCVVPVTLRQE
ncbi:MAG: SOS response-associated peptidase [Gammaproteobacteria bacterium]|nr:SOS response-associated peptidase [Gammaproteobacteria bacterium]